MDPESVDVTAGLGGFLAFFLLAVALYFLMRNMNVRLRRMSYREEQEAREAGAEEPGTKEPGTKEPGAKEPGAKETGTADGPDLG